MNYINILDNSHIVGRPFNSKLLTQQYLEHLDLVPKHIISELPPAPIEKTKGKRAPRKVDDKNIYVSDPFFVERRKDIAFLAYIEAPSGKHIVRTFFFSRSQGTARVLHAYKFKLDGEREVPSWNDKGHGEESITLPIFVQEKLSKLSKIKPLKVPDSYFIFYGTAVESSQSKDFKKEVRKEPIKLAGEFYHPEPNKKVAPDKIDFSDESHRPNFSKLIMKWTIKTDLYGEIKARVFPSQDEKLNYLFLTDKLNRSWIAFIDNKSDISSFGTRKEWVSAGSLTTPAFDYLTEKTDQTGGYGNASMKTGSYVDMYKNYISKVAIIKDFEKFLAQ